MTKGKDENSELVQSKVLFYPTTKRLFCKRTLISILKNDSIMFESVLSLAKHSLQPGGNREGIVQLLTSNRKLPAVDEEYRGSLLKVLNCLLADDFPKVSAQDFWDKSKMLSILQDAYEGSFVHLAAALGRSEILATIAQLENAREEESRAMWCGSDVTGKSPLMWAVQMKHVGVTREIIRYMLSLSDNQSKRAAMMTLTNAVRDGTLLVRKYPGVKASVKALLEDTGSILHMKYCVSVEWHVFNRSVRDVTDAMNITCANQYMRRDTTNPFHFAVFLYSQSPMTKKERQIVQLMLAAGADPNAVYTWDRGPLEDAVHGTAAHFALASYLPAALAAIHTGSPGGRAIERGPSHLDMLRLLQDHGADLTKPDGRGRTPLDCLPPDAFPELIRFLLDVHGTKAGEGQAAGMEVGAGHAPPGLGEAAGEGEQGGQNGGPGLHAGPGQNNVPASPEAPMNGQAAPPGQGNGQVNPQGHVNGHANPQVQINGHANPQGQINGHANPQGQINGHANPQGQVNGQVNPQGQINGHVNLQGQINGQVNPQGQINGQMNQQVHINGHANAQGPINGHVNPQGQINGQVNPQGQVNGQVNPQGQLNGHVIPQGHINGQVNPQGQVNENGLP